MNIDALENLQRVAEQCLRTNAPLDMSTFWSNCGTFGCLAGWAAQDPWFQHQGLQVLSATPAGNRAGVVVWWRRRNGVPYAIRDFDALQEFFGLDEFQTNYLFADNPWATSVEQIKDWHDALARINEVIRGEV